MKVAAGFLIAYDYALLKYAIPLVYQEADYIVLGLDRDFRSFSGEKFMVDAGFFEWVKAFDTKSKIIWNRGDFFQMGMGPMQVETHTRNTLFTVLPEKMDWYIQLDSDEYFLNFSGFLQWLEDNVPEGKNTISVRLKTVFKQDDNGFYVTGGIPEVAYAATKSPIYTLGRRTKDMQETEAPFFILHQSWARPVDEVKFKLSQWGHRDDVSPGKFFHIWHTCNRMNYRLYRQFHPLYPPLWPFLEYIKAPDILYLIKFFSENLPSPKPTPSLNLLQRILKKIMLIKWRYAS